MIQNGIAFVSERWEKINDILRTRGRVTVDELVRMLEVSPTTVRRDLREMHRQGLIARSRGGAVGLPQVGFDRSLAEARQLHVREKELIGQIAATLVEDGDTIMLDSGSTTYQVARFLDASRLTVVTNALDIVGLLSAKPHIEVILVGGMVRVYGGHTLGPMAVNTLATLRADKAILGANAISATDGLSTPHPLVAEVKKMMITHSRQLIVVADHSKLQEVALCHVAPISAVNTLVTDARISEEEKKAFTEAGVGVLVAGAKPLESLALSTSLESLTKPLTD